MKILILGGNRFFGKKLVQRLLDKQYEVTVLNRGNIEDGFGDKIKRLLCDRTDIEKMKALLSDRSWDVVFDNICYNAEQAKDSVSFFKNRTKRFVFTSSKSVYEPGDELTEADYEALEHKFQREITYAEGKRQAETIFAREPNFPYTAIRFPIVVGTDDYTKRLIFHIDRINEGKEIYFPNLNALMTFISSDDAAKTVEFLIESDAIGPVNACSSQAISLNDFISLVEQVTQKKINLGKEATEENHSPYGIESNWYMKCDKLSNLGFDCAPLESWLKPTIESAYNM